MRILQVCPRYPPQTGGVETHVREISERLVDRGHHVTVHTADAGAEGARRAQRNGVEVRRHRGIAPSGAYHLAPGIATAVRRADVDVVHAHNYHAFPLLLAAMGVTEARFVVTPHYHGLSASPLRSRLLSLYRPLGRWALRRADGVIAVSDWEQSRLAADFAVDATVVPNGIDVDRFRSAEPEERDRPYLLSVGRLAAYKGVQHVIRALPELSGYQLVVVGSGPHRAALERAATESGVADDVTFLGSVDDERLAALYAGADAFVTLSSIEAYGLTVAEALAAGTPCVVRVEGALAAWTGREGVVGVERLDPEPVAAAVREAVDLEPDRSAVADWSSVVTALVEVYTG